MATAERISDRARVRALIEQADAILAECKSIRALFRRSTKRGNPFRNESLTASVNAISSIMVPVRSEMGRISYLSLGDQLEDQLRATSRQLQLERQKLRKMLGIYSN
jgi:hypothetical protein